MVPPRRKRPESPGGPLRSGRVTIESFESRVLRRNPLGDPFVREVPVYLPPGYDDSPARRYPVLFVLTGFTGSGRALLNRSNFNEALDQRMDRLTASGAVRPMIVVMPDAYTRYGGSQYLNSTATGRYEDHVVKELVPWVDRQFRTKAEPAHRGVMGKSSGGYGALVLGMRHPDVFGAIASHSGDACFPYAYLPDFPKTVNGLERHGGLAGFLRAFDRAPRKTHDLVAILNIVAMSACYSPNPRSPHGFDFPFEPGTGRIIDRVWKRWLDLDPVNMIPAHAAALRRARLVYLDAGTRDEWNLHLGARMMAGILARHRVPHVHEEFDDGHMDVSYRYDSSLPLLSKALA